VTTHPIFEWSKLIKTVKESTQTELNSSPTNGVPNSAGFAILETLQTQLHTPNHPSSCRR
jgi:hypothetical protein